MDSQLSVVLVKTGLVDSNVLAEFKRWGLPLEFREDVQGCSTAEEVVSHIHDYLESDIRVKLRDTDLDILQRYIQTQHPGRLHYRGPNDEKLSVDVHFCITDLGEYVIPWRSESIQDLMLESTTSLRFTPKDSSDRKTVYFTDVRELFFGEHKAFMVCEPSGD